MNWHCPMAPAQEPRMRSGAIAPRSRMRKAASSSEDRKSTRLNSSHDQISYAVFCLKKKKKKKAEGQHEVASVNYIDRFNAPGEADHNADAGLRSLRPDWTGVITPDRYSRLIHAHRP